MERKKSNSFRQDKKHNAPRDLRLLLFLAKAAISALLLYLSLRRVNLDSVAQRLGGLDWGWIEACGLLCLIATAGIVFGGALW